MKVSIIACMFALALTMGEPVRSQTPPTEQTVTIGGSVTLLCPFRPNDLWIWVYWKKNDHTIYSLEIKSNTITTNNTRYESSDHATRLTINDLQETDSGIYHCKVATLFFIKEGGTVLLSAKDQKGGLSTTYPSVPFQTFTTVPPQHAEDSNIFFAFSIFFLIINIVIITVFIIFKYRKQLKDSRFVIACKSLVPRRTATPLVYDAPYSDNKEVDTHIGLLSCDTRERDCVNSCPEEQSSEQTNHSPLRNTGVISLICTESATLHYSAAAHSTPSTTITTTVADVAATSSTTATTTSTPEFTVSTKTSQQSDDKESEVKGEQTPMTKVLEGQMRSIVRESNTRDAARNLISLVILDAPGENSGSALSQQVALRYNQPADETEKIQIKIESVDLDERPSASRKLAQFICKMTHLKDLLLRGRFHDDFFSTSSSMASSATIQTLNIESGDLSERPSASRDLAQFICEMLHLKDLTLNGQYHDDFFSTSSSMASCAKIETLNIDSWHLSRRSSASRDLAQFICKMPHLKNLSLRYQVRDDFFSTSSSMASSAKIETLDIEPLGQIDLFCGLNALAQFFKTDLTHRSQFHDDFYATLSSMASSSKIERLNIWAGDLSERPSASRDLAQFICNMPHLKNLTFSGLCHDDFFSISSSMSSDAKRGNTSPTLTELTVDDETLKGWQGLGSMFDNVMRVTLQVRSTISYDVIKMIHLPGATELTIQTHDDAGRPACFYDELEPTTLRNALLNVSPQLVKVTFSDLDIGNSKMELILQAFRPPHSIKHLRSMRFIRCGTDLSLDDTTIACSQNQVMEVEMEHGKPRGDYFIE